MNVNYDEELEEESNDDDNSGSSNVSKSYIFLCDTADPDERGVALNHNTDSRELTKQGGDLYDAFTQREGGKNVWSLSDVFSHIAVNYAKLTDYLPERPDVWVDFTESLFNTVEASFDGDNMPALDLFGPSAREMVAYAANDDEVSIDDLEKHIEDVRDARGDDE